MSKEREGFEGCYKTSRDYRFYVKHEMSEKQIFEFKNGRYVVDCVNDAWKIWQEAKVRAVPEGFVLVSQKDLLELTIAINAVDLETHTESKTNEVREMWQQVAIKLMALGTSDCPNEP